MKNKGLLIITILLGIILLGLGIIYTIEYNKKNNDDKITSIITMDINPSIKVSLHNDKVIKVEALNEDAKEYIKDEYKNITFDTFISHLVNDLKENEVINNELIILINVDGDYNAKEVIEDTLDNIDINVTIIEPIITEEDISKSLEYGITPAKASYINEVIKEKGLSFEELKDKNITELDGIKNEVEELQNNEVNNSNNSNTNTNNSTSNNDTYIGNTSNTYPDPPTDPTDTSGLWCSWNQNRPQWYNYTYSSMINQMNLLSTSLNNLGLTYSDMIGNYVGGASKDSRSSYCLAYKVIITTKSLRYTLIIDSVKGSIIEKNTENVPTPSITSDGAVDIALNHFGLSRNDCNVCSANFSTNGEGSPNFYYRYDVSLNMVDGTSHILDINALTGSIVRVYR